MAPVWIVGKDILASRTPVPRKDVDWMTVAAGSRLGPYQIDVLLGAGGMGEVWKARDTRLDRQVAIKVLSPSIAESEQFRARFEREAKAISSLNHPNICTLFDVGHDSGSHYLVMELIEGESLADRLRKGPLPLDQLLRAGAQVADALDRAHKQGIVHRDLKPGNVMLTKAGAKLLDFGLARSGNDSSIAHGDMTEAKPLTQEGTVLGTFQYMAPEQLAGEEADARTDIFALGCVLYEMLTGERAFQGKNKTSLIGAIVSGEPRSINSLQPLTPPMLEHVIRKCLNKDPDDRWQSAHDVAEELRWTSEAGSQAGLALPALRRRKTTAILLWALCGALAAVAGFFAYLAATRRQVPSRFYRTSIVLPSYPDYYSGPMAISPDGTSLAYAAQDSAGQRVLWIRRFGESAPIALPATSEASVPFWSPDNQSLAYIGGGRRLHKVASGGGEPEVLTPVTEFNAGGGAWSARGTILFTPVADGAIYRMPATGGDSTPITDPVKLGHRSHRWPLVLPGDEHFLFLAMGKPGSKTAQGIYFASMDGITTPRFVTAADSNVAFVAPGYLLFCREGVLRAQRFDAESGTVSGEPVSIGPLQYTTRFMAGIFSASSGSIVYQERGTEQLTELVWVDRTGKRLDTVGATGYYWSPSLSRDGRRVAVDRSESTGNGDIWILEVSRPGATRFTFDPANESGPMWMPGDSEIVYFVDPNRSNSDLIARRVGAAGHRMLTSTPSVGEFPTDISNDGRFLILEMRAIGGSSTGTDIGVYSFADGKVTAFLASPFEEEAGDLSPDGNWLAYITNESGRYEVYVQSFPVAGAQYQISTSGGTMPKWSPDGRELIYLATDGKLMSVPITSAAAGFQAGTPNALFPVRLRDATNAQFDMSADGKRFLLNAIAPRADQPLTLLVNWQERYFPDDKR